MSKEEAFDKIVEIVSERKFLDLDGCLNRLQKVQDIVRDYLKGEMNK